MTKKVPKKWNLFYLGIPSKGEFILTIAFTWLCTYSYAISNEHGAPIDSPDYPREKRATVKETFFLVDNMDCQWLVGIG